jgi:nucleoid-associated protein YgaU
MALRSLSLNLDDALYQAALARAQREGKTLEQVLAEFISGYAGTVSPVTEPSPPDSAPPPLGTTPSQPTTAPATPTTYTVQPGDSLSKIARQIYNDASKYPLIQKANNLVNPSLIRVGQVLVIPPL